MKLRVPYLVLSLVLVFGAGNAFATCPTDPGYYCLFAGCWWDFSPDPSCVETYGSATETDSCANTTAWATGSYFSLISYTFTVTEDVSGWWDGGGWITFQDPSNGTSYVDGWASVVHNNVQTDTPLFYHDGGDGDFECEQLYGGFYAVQGDTVTISFNSIKQNGTNPTIEVSSPMIMTELGQ